MESTFKVASMSARHNVKATCEVDSTENLTPLVRERGVYVKHIHACLLHTQ